jgi:hypothetical protein
MTKQTDVKTELQRLYEIQNQLFHQLSSLNIQCIDAEKMAETVDREIGHGTRRYDELQQAKDELALLKKERDEINRKYFEALEMYERYHHDVRNELMEKTISLFGETLLIHNQALKKVTEWRQSLAFIQKFYIGRAVRKTYGFFVSTERMAPEPILQLDDEIAVDVLKRIIRGDITIEVPKKNIYSKVSERRRGTVNA